MKDFKLLFIYLFVITVFVSCSSDDPDAITTESFDAFEELNISYGNDSDQVFDLFY